MSRTNETLVKVQEEIHKIYLKESQFRLFCSHTGESTITLNETKIIDQTLLEIEEELNKFDVIETFHTVYIV